MKPIQSIDPMQVIGPFYRLKSMDEDFATARRVTIRASVHSDEHVLLGRELEEHLGLKGRHLTRW
jgi:hypothetical protein